jgi:broad specificity phosphatase PhoE
LKYRFLSIVFFLLVFWSNFIYCEKKFYFIRHGETNWNLKKSIGTNNSFLNSTGIQQAKVAAQKLKKENIDIIITSPYWRSRQTAILIAETLKKPIIIIPELMEYDFDRDENTITFYRRVQKGLQKALQYPGSVLIVAHGGIGGSLQKILQTPTHYFENAQPYLFQLADHYWREHTI